MTGEPSLLDNEVRNLKQQVDENQRTVLERLTALEKAILEKMDKLNEISSVESSFSVRSRRRYTKRQTTGSFASRLAVSDNDAGAASPDKQDMRNEKDLTVSRSSPWDA